MGWLIINFIWQQQELEGMLRFCFILAGLILAWYGIQHLRRQAWFKPDKIRHFLLNRRHVLIWIVSKLWKLFKK